MRKRNRPKFTGQEVERMEALMTDFQFRKLMQMVLAIMKKSDNLEEAIKEIEIIASQEDKENTEK
jgi:aspartate oxidase